MGKSGGSEAAAGAGWVVLWFKITPPWEMRAVRK
jgi:hypothetical protein